MNDDDKEAADSQATPSWRCTQSGRELEIIITVDRDKIEEAQRFLEVLDQQIKAGKWFQC
jgi:hypothetical protein